MTVVALVTSDLWRYGKAFGSLLAELPPGPPTTRVRPDPVLHRRPAARPSVPRVVSAYSPACRGMYGETGSVADLGMVDF